MNNTSEIWKPVIFEGVDYTGLYEISNFGNIFLHTPKGKKFLAKNRTRRRSVLLRKGDFKRAITVARIMASVFIRPLKDNEVADHIDNDPTNDYMYNIQILPYGQNSIKDKRKISDLPFNVSFKKSVTGRNFKVAVHIRKNEKYNSTLLTLGNYLTINQAIEARERAKDLIKECGIINLDKVRLLVIKKIDKYRKELGFPIVKRWPKESLKK